MADGVDRLGNIERWGTDLGWMLACSGVHPEAVRIVESLQRQLAVECEAKHAVRQQLEGAVERARQDYEAWVSERRMLREALAEYGETDEQLAARYAALRGR